MACGRSGLSVNGLIPDQEDVTDTCQRAPMSLATPRRTPEMVICRARRILLAESAANRTPGGSGSDAQAAGVVESLYCLMLLLCTSANLGSGVSGGRCGLTTSLNQASC